MIPVLLPGGPAPEALPDFLKERTSFLTLLVIPTIYEIMVEWREKVRGMFRRKAKAPVARAEAP